MNDLSIRDQSLFDITVRRHWKPHAGTAVGGGGAVVVTLGAPVAGSGLTALGMSSTAASATVTGGLWVGGCCGAYRAIVNTAQSAGTASVTGDVTPVAFNLGTFAGGTAVGTMSIFGSRSGGRYIADTLGELAGNGPSPALMMNSGNVLSYEWRNAYNPFYKNGNNLTWLSSAPTPFSGGFSAAGIGSGLTSSFTGK